MSERKNIDRLFQEKFKDFEVAPQQHVWDNIEAKLKEKKKRRVIPFWFRLSGVAAALLIGLVIADRLHDNPTQPENNVVLENTGKNATDAPKGKTATGIAVEDNTKPDAVKTQQQATSPMPIDNHPNPGNNNLNPNNTSTIPVASQAHKQHNDPQPNAPQKYQSGGKNSRLVPKQENAVVYTKRNSQKNADGKNRLTEEKRKNNLQLQNNQTTVAENGGNALKTQSVINQNTDAKNPGNTDNPNPKTSGTGIANDILNNKSSDASPEKTTAITENENTDIKKTDTTAVATVVPNALEELLNEKEKQVTNAERKVNRWQITSNVAPIYFSSTTNGSPLDSRFENNKKTYAPTLAYGVGVQYAINKKLAVRSGVNSVGLEYNTNDIVFFQTESARKIQNVNNNIQGSMIEVDNPSQGLAATLGRTSSSSNVGRTIKQYNGNINQKTGYVEVPVELSYKITDRKFGLEVIGGISTLFLNQNEVSLVGSGIEMNIGEANNLSSLHFSTNLGLGIKYKLMKSLQAHLEPTFKYQINTYSNDAGNFKPYFFGLYTGLSYRF